VHYAARKGGLVLFAATAEFARGHWLNWAGPRWLPIALATVRRYGGLQQAGGAPVSFVSNGEVGGGATRSLVVDGCTGGFFVYGVRRLYRRISWGDQPLSTGPTGAGARERDNDAGRNCSGRELPDGGRLCCIWGVYRWQRR